MPNYYDILGVQSTATVEDIRRAYRIKAKSIHPDVSGEPDAQARFSALAEAYQTLTDRARRRDYDSRLRTGTSRSPAASGARSTRAHYTWTNIATDSAGKPDRLSEFDELYETFFKPHTRTSDRSPHHE
ncbi:MAG: DnaJ domain-containing protein [Phycisphaerales bacterium]